MKRSIYRITHATEDWKIRCNWDIYAASNQEAQEISEHLRECCIKNGHWTPAHTIIKINKTYHP